MSKLSKTESNIKKTEKLRNVLLTLPPFCLEFFRGIEPRTSLLTRINYAYDLRLFFSFLKDELGIDSKHMNPEDLQNLTLTDFEVYLEYLRLYYKDDSPVENGENGIARKLSSIRSLYKFFYKKGVLSANITEKLETPKIHEKPIIRLNNDEALALINNIESGYGMSDRQLMFHEKTKIRDLAIITLFLTTGIRISELCALDVSDIDFNSNEFKVLRKGGNEMMLYFGKETKDALIAYIEDRKKNASYAQDSPMFLSLKNKRMSVRALEELVKKYARFTVPLKNISPHKLRSTYGTMLYEETGDIYLVADVLGHKDINTTRKHYAAVDEERRKLASGAVKIREDKPN